MSTQKRVTKSHRQGKGTVDQILDNPDAQRLTGCLPYVRSHWATLPQGGFDKLYTHRFRSLPAVEDGQHVQLTRTKLPGVCL
jgi:hypothetical protein